MALLRLKLKAQRPLLALACAVVAFQLVLGQASSDVLAHREPPLGIAVQHNAQDALSNELVRDLAAGAGLEVVQVSTALEPDEVFQAVRVQGLVVVPEEFGALVEEGKHAPVTLYPAPGVLRDEYVSEQVASAVMQLRARHDLQVALEDFADSDGVMDAANSSNLLEVVYEGPALQSSSQESTPAHGVAALLILLAYLHAAFTVPTSEDKRLLVHGKRTFFLQLGASLLAIWLVWFVVSLLYFALVALLLKVAFDLFSFLGFLAIALYVSLLAAFLAQLVGRQVASWVFLPLFLLNMTIGGGLWGEVVLSWFFAPLVPVSAVAVLDSPLLWGIATLCGAAALMAAALIRAASLPFTEKLKNLSITP
jgi:hypothetical protein